MDIRPTLNKIFEDLSDNKIESAVMGCLRVARRIKDYPNAAMFLREIHPTKNEVVRVLYEDMAHLKPEAMKFVVEWSAERWLESHTSVVSPLPFEADSDRKVILRTVGEIETEISSLQNDIEALNVPAGMSPFDTAACHDMNEQNRQLYTMGIHSLRNVLMKIKSRCLSFAMQIENQIDSQQKGNSLIGDIQEEVNNYFRVRAPRVHDKLLKAVELASSSAMEDSALLLTSVRRALAEAADHFYPPVDEPVRCVDGSMRDLGKDKYLSRLREYLALNVSSGNARDLLAAEIELLGNFLKRLNDLSSKGVHSDVTRSEARQGIIGLYMLLFNIIQKITHVSEEDPVESNSSPLAPSS